MTIRRLGKGIALLFAAAMAGPAAAAQFTFTVPIEIRDIDPQFPYAQVGCNIQAADNTMLGFTNVIFDIRPNNRPYSANVTVPVDLIPGKSASAVTNYVCGLMFCKTSQGATCVRPVPSNPATPQPEPGTQFIPQVNGQIR